MRTAGPVLAMVLGLIVSGAAASTELDPVLENRVRALTAELRCPVCQNLSVADSPSGMAVQMREFVRDEISEGKSDREVMDYLVTKYGEWILLAPPRRGFNWLLWGGGPVLLVAGAFWALAWVRKNRGGIEIPEEDISAEVAKELARRLKESE